MIFPRPGLGLGLVAGPYVTYGLGSPVEVEVVVSDGLPPGVHASYPLGAWDHANTTTPSGPHARGVQLLVGLHTWASGVPWRHRAVDPQSDRHVLGILSTYRHWRLGAIEAGVHFGARTTARTHGSPRPSSQGRHH